MYRSIVLLSALLSVLVRGQSAPAADGLIVPFTSGLPLCATNCGPLYDAQGACTVPVTPDTDKNCFCSYTKLQPFLTGVAGVASVCGATSCTDATSQGQIQSWFEGYCGIKSSGPSTTTVASGTKPSGTSSSSSSSSSTSQPSSGNTNTSWMHSHAKWVAMLIVLFFGITIIWVAACILRRRYLRKKEKEFEMRPPVAWGPHQLQGATGGYNYGDGVVDSAKDGHSSPPNAHLRNKEAKDMVASVSPADSRQPKRESKGWLTKQRNFV